VASDWLVPVPDVFSTLQAAAIGTAGFTAMLAVLAIEETAAAAGPDSTVLVTGAAGGVGSIAIAVLSRLGYRVTASTGRSSEHDYLRSLGAADIIDRAELSEPGKALQGQRWSAAVDSVGGTTLANVLAQTSYGGIVASCGLAQSAKLDTTVMPFILRAVTLTGINSVYCPMPARRTAWKRLASDLDLGVLDSMTETVALADAIGVAERILAGGVRGRTVVDVRN
jgi:acrylyl-CoA reductase (NADPH)